LIINSPLEYCISEEHSRVTTRSTKYTKQRRSAL
jgi:hypothetical protein